MQRLGRDIQSKLTGLCSKKRPSIFRDASARNLATFSWDRLVSDLEERAPTFHNLLYMCTDIKRRKRQPTKKKHKKPNRPRNEAIVGVCASLLLRHKNHNMNLMQRIVSLILHRGHAAKQVHMYYFCHLLLLTHYYYIPGLQTAPETLFLFVSSGYQHIFGQTRM